MVRFYFYFLAIQVLVKILLPLSLFLFGHSLSDTRSEILMHNRLPVDYAEVVQL